MNVELLWFECANTECDFVPLKTKKDKIKIAWSKGKSIYAEKRPRMFMRYVEGEKLFRDGLILFSCKFGNIVLYDEYDFHPVNSYLNPIKTSELCTKCIRQMENEKLLCIK